VAGSPQPITELLLAWCDGNRAALDSLVPLVHEELRRLAHRHMRQERVDHVLQTTALVNEAYLQLVDVKRVKWRDRTHFFAICARVMRQILVHDARSRHALKRGGPGFAPVSLDQSAVVAATPSANLIELDDALNALAALDPRKASVVELRFFAGLTHEEIAEVLGVSADTVWRDWDLAKTWLYRELRHS